MRKRPVNVVKKIFYKAVTGAGRLVDPSLNSTPIEDLFELADRHSGNPAQYGG